MTQSVPARALILIADDEEGMRMLQRRILVGDGYDVVEAENGAVAVEMMRANPAIDFLIADLDMPVLGGQDMVNQVRETRPDLPVLYVTAHSGKLFRDRPELKDGEAFLDKPFSGRGLLEAISLLRTGRINQTPVATEPQTRSSWLGAVGRFFAGKRT